MSKHIIFTTVLGYIVCTWGIFANNTDLVVIGCAFFLRAGQLDLERKLS